VQFDGWRIQIHKEQDAVKLYSRRGVDMAKRFPGLRDACAYLPDCAIEAKLVAADTDGKPGFRALRRAQANLCVWCFDLGILGRGHPRAPTGGAQGDAAQSPDPD
jgi:ATP-dependent DNA ligase